MKTGEENIEIEMKRVASHQLDEEGFITCQPDCQCKGGFHFPFNRFISDLFGSIFLHLTTNRIRFAIRLNVDFVVFDNSYSYFKNKRIRYSVILTPPVSVDELEKGAATLEEKIIE